MTACKVADLAGIDDGHQVAGGDEFGDDASLIPAGGFENDEARLGLGQRPQELLQPGVIIVQRQALAGGPDGDFESVLGDIDTDKVRDTRHGPIPVLRMRARGGAWPPPAPAAVRADSKRPTAIPLWDGLCGRRHDRSTVGRRGAACCAARWLDVSPLRRPHRDSLHHTCSLLGSQHTRHQGHKVGLRGIPGCSSCLCG